MVRGSIYADSSPFQDAEHSYMHAMKKEGQDTGSAIALSEIFVNNQLVAFQELLKSGNEYDAYFQLGMGMHTLMDRNSPSHRGWQTWVPGDILGAIGHIFAESFTGEGVPNAIASIQIYYQQAIK
jgi:hypothetical protein